MDSGPESTINFQLANHEIKLWAVLSDKTLEGIAECASECGDSVNKHAVDYVGAILDDGWEEFDTFKFNPTPAITDKEDLRSRAALAVWQRWEQIGKLPLKEMSDPLHDLMFLVALGPASQEEAERDPNGTANDIFGPEADAFGNI